MLRAGHSDVCQWPSMHGYISTFNHAPIADFVLLGVDRWIIESIVMSFNKAFITSKLLQQRCREFRLYSAPYVQHNELHWCFLMIFKLCDVIHGFSPSRLEVRSMFLSVGEWGWGVEGKQVGSMDEESQVRGCYNITFICTPTNQETVSVLEKTQANKTFRTWKQM